MAGIGCLSGILKGYFDFGYFLCVCPFRFAAQKDGTFFVKTCKYQQILCAFIHILSILNILTYRWSMLFPEVERKSVPARYFFVLAHACSHFVNIVTFKRVWMNRNDFVNLFNYVRKTDESQSRLSQGLDTIRGGFHWSSLIQSNLFIGTLCIIYLIMSAAYVSNQVLLPMDCLSNLLPWQNIKLKAKAHDVFGLRWSSENLTNESRFESMEFEYKSFTPCYGTLATILEISAIARSVTRYFSSLFILTGVLTFWNATYLSGRRLKQSFPSKTLDVKAADVDVNPTSFSDSSVILVRYRRRVSLPIFEEEEANIFNAHNWADVYKIYNELKTLSQLINTAFGSIITVTLARAILFNSANLDHALQNDQNFEAKVLLLLLSVHDAVVFLLSADACSHVMHLTLK
ncbi:unnamed protein product [Orchesella dallaii]|uniref:Gustatory receptor n=1 Tax=Orchesella dallaii TaxID=48710 RepID=A0ABP1PT16_9HEXA